MIGGDPARRIFCAIDTDALPSALRLAKTLGGHIGGVKVGLEFFTAAGPEGVKAMAAAAPAIEAAPPSPARAAKLFASLAPAAIIEQAFLPFASAPDTANAEAGREARASFLWELFPAGAAEGGAALSIEHLAAFLGRAAARHHMSQPGASQFPPAVSTID